MKTSGHPGGPVEARLVRERHSPPSRRAPAPSHTPPEKLFYKIGEVSRMTGLEGYVLRYWETEFPFLHPRKSGGGQRVYTKQDVELVLNIKRMLYEQKYTILGAKKQLQGRTKAALERAPSKHAIGTIKGQLQSILDDLKAFESSPSSASRRTEAQGGVGSDSFGA